MTEETDGPVSVAHPSQHCVDRQRGGTARPVRRGSRGRRGAAPEEGAPRAARGPDPARVRRVGHPLPRLRLGGGHRSVHLPRHLDRLLGALRADRSFRLLLVTQLLDILLTTTAGQMLVGGFLPSGGSGCGGSWLRSEPSSSSRCDAPSAGSSPSSLVFLLTGIAGEVLFRDADLPIWFTSTMLALNVIGAGAVAFTLLASFANQRNAALAALRVEQEKSEALLVNILPRSIAERLKGASQTIADHFDSASILFADVVDFTPLAQRLAPAEVVGILDQLFSHFDTLVERHGLEKIKTIGDCYMAAAGVPDPSPDHARRAALLALDMREAVATSAVGDGSGLELRIGINSGPVIAGVIGTKRFLYDLWGDAVNTASRMESQSTPGEIQITRATYELLKDEFVCRRRGTIQVKGKGQMETWYLVRSRSGERRTETSSRSEATQAYHQDGG